LSPLDEDVERAELDLFIVLARMQRVEIGDAVDAEDDGLAIEHESASRSKLQPDSALNSDFTRAVR
jgi:hypothetical protein